MSVDATLQLLRETLGSPSPVRSSAAWKGYTAPLGIAQTLAPASQDDAQPFPYRTQTAEVVWGKAADLIAKHPEMNEAEILKLAFEESGANPLDLSPEDWRLLEMAIEWRKNGVLGINRPRIGGAPGGPANFYQQGHELAKRGAP